MSDAVPPPSPAEPLGPSGSTPAASPPPSTPPPPSTGYSTPPPAPATAPAAGTSLSQSLSGVQPLDLAQMALAGLIFIASLLPFYSYSIDLGDLGGLTGLGGGGTERVNAWHGFFGWFAVLLALAAAGVLAARLLGGIVIPSLRTVVLGLFAASLVCLLLALLVMPGGGYDGAGFDSGHSFGYWLALLCALAATGLAFVRKDETV